MADSLAVVRGFRVQARGGWSPGALAGSSAADYSALEQASRRFLHPSEEAYFAALPALRRRTSYLLGRYAAKQALAKVLGGVDPAAIEIAAGEFGQPVVRHSGSEPLDVSISHTDDEACAIAFSPLVPMAIDVERFGLRRIEVMRTAALSDELAEAGRRGLPTPTAVAVIWAAKEALSKALRCGLTCPFEVLAIESLDTTGAVLGGTFRHFGQYRFHAWTGRDLVVSIVLPKTVRLDVDVPAVLPGLQCA